MHYGKFAAGGYTISHLTWFV